MQKYRIMQRVTCTRSKYVEAYLNSGDREKRKSVMQANYHTHSRWCRHGVGEIEEYIEEAIRCGLREIAITEHVPHNHTEDTWIPWDQFPEYDAALNHAIKEYEGRIRVIKGFECEYYPLEMDDYRRFQEEFGYELLFIGQHRCGKNKEIDCFGPKVPY